MCRAGGRRCEHHWTQAQKDADNARRRGLYALKHGTLTQSAPERSEVSQSDSCNLTSTPQDSSLADASLYSEESLSGRINPASITDESYLDYGFQKPTGHFSSGLSKSEKDDHYKLTILNSTKNLEALTVDEKVALGVFTTNQYKSLSLYLHDSPQAPDLTTDAATEEWNDNNEEIVQKTFTQYFADDEEAAYRARGIDQSCASKASTAVVSQTVEGMSSYVETLDSAFTKADGRQRIIYRGESLSKTSHFDTLDVKEYLAQNMQLGSKVSFKGVQSTSVNVENARKYCGGYETDGIMYEIRSASGINIQELSSFPYEQEVLLPRNSQYRVVGVHYVEGATRNATNAVVQLVEVDDEDNIRTKDNLRQEFGEFNAHKFVKEGN